MFKRVIQSILVLFLMILLGGVVNAVVSTYGEWQDHTNYIEINDGDTVYFDVGITTSNQPLDISIRLVNADTGQIIYTYKEDIVDNTFFSDRFEVVEYHYTNPGLYFVAIYGGDNVGDDSTSIISLKVNSVGPGNTAPTISGIPDQTFGVGSGFNDNIMDLYSYADDAETADPDLTYTITSQSDPSVVVCSIDSNRYMDCNVLQLGSSDVTVEVSDGSLTDTDVFTVTVVGNQAPELDQIGDKSVFEGDLLQFVVTAIDLEDDPLTYTAINLPSGASFNNQIFSWTPNYDQSGSYDVVFVVSDGSSTDAETITITVNNVNRAPFLYSINDITVEEGDLVDIDPNASDPDNDALTFTFTSPLDSNGDWQTEEGDEGTYQVTVTVSDGSLTDSQQVTITVEEYEPATYESERRSRFYIDDIKVYDYSLYPGDILEVVIGIERVGDNTVRDIELRVSIPSLGIEKDVPEFDLRKDYIEKTVRIALPYNMDGGTYSIKAIAENKYYDDLEYGNFFVNEIGIDEEGYVSFKVDKGVVGKEAGEITVDTVVKELLPTVTVGLLLVLSMVGMIVFIRKRL